MAQDQKVKWSKEKAEINISNIRENPKVTIVIPTFNRANLVSRAIESALSQTISCEVILCDHGSTDETPLIAAKYGDRIRYIRRNVDNGPIACWRDGIEQATGEFVHITYDDDWIEPIFIEKTLQFLKPDVAFVYTRVNVHSFDPPLTKPLMFHPPGVRNIKEIVNYLLKQELTISPGCALFRKVDLLENLLTEIPGASGVYGKKSGVGEDLLIFLLTSLKYRKYAHIPETLSHFLAHPKSITINAMNVGNQQKLVNAYSHAKNVYLNRSGSISARNRITSIFFSIKWWFESGVVNQLVLFRLNFMERCRRF